jgi:hypothetical protein
LRLSAREHRRLTDFHYGLTNAGRSMMMRRISPKKSLT